jgi:hypothetical protein
MEEMVTIAEASIVHNIDAINAHGGTVKNIGRI